MSLSGSELADLRLSARDTKTDLQDHSDMSLTGRELFDLWPLVWDI